MFAPMSSGTNDPDRALAMPGMGGMGGMHP